MVTFKRKTVGVDSFGVRHFYFYADGLPKGFACHYQPEEAHRPRGPWFLVVKSRGRERVLRCDSKAAAVESAQQWCASATRKTRVVRDG